MTAPSAAPTDAPPASKSDAALKRFEHRMEIPMLVLSVIFLVLLVIPVLIPDLAAPWRHAIGVTDTIVWVLFVAEYLIRLYLAPRKLRFIWRNPLDLIVVAVPLLRPLRLARLARLARIAALAGLVSRHSRRRMHIDIAVQVVTVAVVIVFVGAVAMLDAERHAPGSHIHTFGDALWWALSTVTTVGYGDTYPVTGEGRLIAGAVMLTGIAVLGVVTASVAGWFVDNLQSIQSEETKELRQAEQIDARLTELVQRLARLEARLGSDNDPLPPVA